jgi:hypothetical protein
MAGSRRSTPPKLTKVQALAEFQAQPDLASNITAACKRWGVSRGTVRNWLGDWTAAAPGTAMATTVLPPLPSLEAPPLQWHIAPPAPATRSGVVAVANVMLLAAGMIIAVSLLVNARFAYLQGPTLLDSIGLAALGFAIELVEVTGPTGATWLWRFGYHATARLIWAIWLVALVVTALAAYGSGSKNIGDAIAGRQSTANQRSELQSVIDNPSAAVVAAQATVKTAAEFVKQECQDGLGKNCRARQDDLKQRQTKLDEAIAKHDGEVTDAKDKLAVLPKIGAPDPQGEVGHLVYILGLMFMQAFAGFLVLGGVTLRQHRQMPEIRPQEARRA